jgi:hypothetical protein
MSGVAGASSGRVAPTSGEASSTIVHLDAFAEESAALNAAWSSNEIVEGLHFHELYFHPNHDEVPSPDRFIIVQTTTSIGVAFVESSPAVPIDGVGASLLDFWQASSGAWRIASIDALCRRNLPFPDREILLRGSSSMKGIARANFVVDEVQRLVGELAGATVTMLGAVGTILATLDERGATISATDLSSGAIGHVVRGCRVEDGHEAEVTRRNLEQADVALVTGMTATTESLMRVLEEARRADCLVVVFAQTGASVASRYLRLGASAVVSEPYPFYLLPGDSLVRSYRAVSS